MGATFLLPILLAVRGLAPDAVPSDEQQAGSPPSTIPASTQASDGSAASDVNKPQEKPPQTPPDAEHAVDKRVLGVLPNYRTINETGVYTPIDAKQKMVIAMKDSFDYPLIGLGGMLAGLSQLEDSDHNYGQGVQGYAKRFGAYYADEAIGNIFTEGLMPVLLHEDPRYRIIGKERGGVGKRAWYAFSRIFVTRTDTGGTRFNFSEWTGNSIGVAIGTIYHKDNRDWSDATTALVEQCAIDGVSQILKEFWPDMKPVVRRWFHMKPEPPPPTSTNTN